jgi:mRNA interferase RelE/StbE
LNLEKALEEDLSKIRDAELLKRIQTVIEELEITDSMTDLTNVKKLKAEGD